MTRSIECAQCRQRFDPSEELCGECIEAEQSTPAWLDFPDGVGHWWRRAPSGYCDVVFLDDEKVTSMDVIEPGYGWQWQRVAPPREG